MLHVIIKYGVLFQNFEIKESPTHVAFAGHDVVYKFKGDEAGLSTKETHLRIVFVLNRNGLLKETHRTCHSWLDNRFLVLTHDIVPFHAA